MLSTSHLSRLVFMSGVAAALQESFLQHVPAWLVVQNASFADPFERGIRALIYVGAKG